MIVAFLLARGFLLKNGHGDLCPHFPVTHLGH